MNLLMNPKATKIAHNHVPGDWASDMDEKNIKVDTPHVQIGHNLLELNFKKLKIMKKVVIKNLKFLMV